MRSEKISWGESGLLDMNRSVWIYVVLTLAIAFALTAGCKGKGGGGAPVPPAGTAKGSFIKDAHKTSAGPWLPGHFETGSANWRTQHLYSGTSGTTQLFGSGFITAIGFRADAAVLSAVTCTGVTIRMGHTSLGALKTTSARIPDLERLIVQTENRINLLVGRPPRPIARGTALIDQRVYPDVPVGLPSALLERRPDVRQAEDQLHAANAAIGVATANFFPTISLTGLFGGISPELSELFGTNKTWSVGAGLLGPIFQGGRLKQAKAAAVAQWEQALATYEKTVTSALGDVSNALVAKQKLADATTQLAAAVTAYEEAVRIANIRYLSGLSSYFEVVDAQQQLFPAQNDLARARRDELSAIVSLYKALGGGWQQAPSTP